MRNRVMVALVAVSLMAIGLSPSLGRAINYAWHVVPAGNSTGGSHLSANDQCYTVWYSWNHSVAHSIETFTNPRRIQFKYLDWYAGYESLPPEVDYRYAAPYLYTNGLPGQNYRVNGVVGVPFDTYDITKWLWVYINYVANDVVILDTPFGLYEGYGQFNGNCADGSLVFWDPPA